METMVRPLTHAADLAALFPQRAWFTELGVCQVADLKSKYFYVNFSRCFYCRKLCLPTHKSCLLLDALPGSHENLRL